MPSLHPPSEPSSDASSMPSLEPRDESSLMSFLQPSLKTSSDPSSLPSLKHHASSYFDAVSAVIPAAVFSPFVEARTLANAERGIM